MLEMERRDLVLDQLSEMRERVIVAPCAGRFEPLPPETFTTEGEWVEPGSELAMVRAGEEHVAVESKFRGWVMGMLAVPGQPVHQGEALFWIWSS
ncbi:MAG: hypothetical protein ABR575_02975 [Actinomycetota bacterium]